MGLVRTVAAFVLAGAAVVAAVLVMVDRGDEGHGYGDVLGDIAPPPETLTGLLDITEVVVVGRISDVMGVTEVWPVSGDGSPARSPIVFTDLRVTVKQSVRGDAGGALTLRHLGDLRALPKDMLDFPAPPRPAPRPRSAVVPGP